MNKKNGVVATIPEKDLTIEQFMEKYPNEEPLYDTDTLKDVFGELDNWNEDDEELESLGKLI